MDPLKVTVVIATGLALAGCAGTLDDLSASSGQDVYVTPGYYGTAAYSVQGYYAQPGYIAPYAYQPGYIAPYAYGPGWGGGRERWHDHEWHERRDHAFQNEGRQSFGPQRQDTRQVPQIAPRPPPAAGSEVDQNRKLLDQLGFRPSR